MSAYQCGKPTGGEKRPGQCCGNQLEDGTSALETGTERYHAVQQVEPHQALTIQRKPMKETTQ